jgi:uncharacterized protein (TIGR00369 family)
MTDPATAGWKPFQWHNDDFPALVGPFWSKREGENWAYGLLAAEKHRNIHGIVHGGMLAMFLDQTLGIACWEAAERNPLVTIQLNTHYISAAKPDEFLEARATILRTTRSLIFVRGQITVSDRIVAAADGVWKRLGA